jgi:hypothetical protein
MNVHILPHSVRRRTRFTCLKFSKGHIWLNCLISVFASLDSILAATTSTVESWMEVVRLPGTSVNSHSMITNPQTNLRSRRRPNLDRRGSRSKRTWRRRRTSLRQTRRRPPREDSLPNARGSSGGGSNGWRGRRMKRRSQQS